MTTLQCLDEMARLNSAHESWEAVNIAYALRVLYNCRLYGLITGGPESDIERCDLILRQGKSIGFEPDEDVAISMARGFSKHQQ